MVGAVVVVAFVVVVPLVVVVVVPLVVVVVVPLVVVVVVVGGACSRRTSTRRLGP